MRNLNLMIKKMKHLPVQAPTPSSSDSFPLSFPIFGEMGKIFLRSVKKINQF